MSLWRLLCCQESQTKPPAPAPMSQKVFLSDVEGGKYKGEYCDEMRNGYGVYTYANDDQYEGQWLDNKRHGRGKMLYKNGDFFMGEWVNDRRQGRGLQVSHDMSKYQGEWKADMIDGWGKLVDPDGSYYEGQFIKGRKDGKGTFYNSQTKKKYSNFYRAGELQLCQLIEADKEVNVNRVNNYPQTMSVHIDKPKITNEDIMAYEHSHPEINGMDMNQIMNYLILVKMKELPFIKLHPKSWKSDHLYQWIKAIDLGYYLKDLEKNKITGSNITSLTQTEVKNQINMKVGDRKKFLRSMEILKNLHVINIKPQKHTIKHLRNFKRPNPSSTYKTPKSSTKFTDIKHDPIVQQNAENEDHEDSPSLQRSIHSPKKNERMPEMDVIYNSTNEPFNTFHTTTLTNIQAQKIKYESLNYDNIQNDYKTEVECDSKEQQRLDALMQDLNADDMLPKRQPSKKMKKKEEDDIHHAVEIQPAPMMRKQQSKRIKIHEPQENQEVKRPNESESSTSSSSSYDDGDELPKNKRKKSRDEKPMQMRQLYEYLKEHHISMNFLIPENQITNIQRIGEGGYGTVYKAKWGGSPVAVKTYLKAGKIHRGSLDDFLKEVQILNNLRHPNIVLYMGMCIQISRYSLITEFLEMGSLFDQLHKNNNKLTHQNMLQIAQDIVLGMVYLHAKGVLHRDLKSSNVLIGDDWKVKLCDFGLSQIHKKKKNKVNKARIGTYQWMAPEVLRRQQNIGFPADVYSFGMVLWEMISNKVPFEDCQPAQIQGLVGHDDTFEMPIPEGGDPFLISIMRKCLKRLPQERPTFFEILQELKEHRTKSTSPKITTAVVPYTAAKLP